MNTGITTLAPGKIIAIGGAKGGVGKSIFAANLGTYLAGRGKRVILIDLDLGGANLHLYMGAWALKHRINDFLDKKVASLEEIAVKTPYGPMLIGGGSSRLGAPNLPFVRKLKLIRALKKLDADYLIIDLGGDTAFNILDFYLAADTGIVITTCDPASYLDAYTFIKMALYRRLTRLFGPESAWHKLKDEAVKNIINDFVNQPAITNGHRVTELIDRIQNETPAKAYLIEQSVKSFHPHLLVNMSRSDSETLDLVHRLRKVAQKMLSIRVDFAGAVAEDPKVAQSAHDLVPEVVSNPNGMLAGYLERLCANLAVKRGASGGSS